LELHWKRGREDAGREEGREGGWVSGCRSTGNIFMSMHMDEGGGWAGTEGEREKEREREGERETGRQRETEERKEGRREGGREGAPVNSLTRSLQKTTACSVVVRRDRS